MVIPRIFGYEDFPVAMVIKWSWEWFSVVWNWSILHAFSPKFRTRSYLSGTLNMIMISSYLLFKLPPIELLLYNCKLWLNILPCLIRFYHGFVFILFEYFVYCYIYVFLSIYKQHNITYCLYALTWCNSIQGLDSFPEPLVDNKRS